MVKQTKHQTGDEDYILMRIEDLKHWLQLNFRHVKINIIDL